MSQDQFDRWLKSQLEDHPSKVDLDREWRFLRDRLDQEEEKDRPLSFWWISGASLILIAGWVLIKSNSFAESNIQDLTVSPSHPSTNHLTEQKTTPKQPLTSEDETLSSEISHDHEPTLYYANRGVHTNEQLISDSDIGFTERPKASLYFDAKEPVLVPSENTPEKESLSQAKGNETMTTLLSTPEDLMLESLADIPPLAPSSLSIVDDLTLDAYAPPKVQGPVASAWKWEFWLTSGWTWQDLSSVQNDALAEGLQKAESGRETVGVEVRTFKPLSPHWRLGLGLRLEQIHSLSRQTFLDTTLGSSEDQLLRKITDTDLSTQLVSGQGTGTQYINAQRVSHQLSHILSVSVLLQYDNILSDRWSYGVFAGLGPQWYLNRSGWGIHKNYKDIDLQPVQDRYLNDVTGILFGGFYWGYRLTPEWTLAAAFEGQSQIIGEKISDHSFTKRTHILGGKVGLQLDIK